MDQDRYAQINQLFNATLERESGERASFLDEACQGDQDLRRQVEKLIEAHQQSTDFLGSPAINILFEQAISSGQTDAMIGKSIGHFEIQRKLGEGGMGTVYLAKDARLDRDVALKILNAELTADKQQLRRFRQDAQAAASLDHVNIVTVFEVGESDGYHYIASKFIEGETLEDYQSREGAMGFAGAIEVAIQIAAALEAAHQKGIVHRDIKPANIMLLPNRSVRVFDFGIAKLNRPEADIEIETEPGFVLGTPSYMSPEQLQGDKIDGRTDIFSFGIVLFELVTGARLFPGSKGQAIASVLTKEPPMIDLYVPDPPVELQRIITKALRKNRDDRHQTASELIQDFRTLKHNLEKTVGPVHAISPSGRVFKARSFTKLALLILIMIAASIAIYIRRPIEHTPPSVSQDPTAPDDSTAGASSALGSSRQSPPAQEIKGRQQESGKSPASSTVSDKPVRPQLSSDNLDEETFIKLLSDARNSQELGQFGKACDKYQEALKTVSASHGNIRWGLINKAKASLNHNEYKEAAEQFRQAFQSIPVE